MLDKAKTKYELLQETLKNLEKQYENQVLLYGKNSTGAEALADKIRSVKFEINSVISALKELEKIDDKTVDGFVDFWNKKLIIS